MTHAGYPQQLQYYIKKEKKRRSSQRHHRRQAFRGSRKKSPDIVFPHNTAGYFCPLRYPSRFSPNLYPLQPKFNSTGGIIYFLFFIFYSVKAHSPVGNLASYDKLSYRSFFVLFLIYFSLFVCFSIITHSQSLSLPLSLKHTLFLPSGWWPLKGHLSEL